MNSLRKPFLRKHLLAVALAAAVPAVALADDYVPPSLPPAPPPPAVAPVGPMTPLPMAPVATPAAPVVQADATFGGAPRVALIPAKSVWVERQVTTPPVTEQRQVPIYETVKVPVQGTLTYPEVQTVAVPRYQHVRDDVKITLWNPFECFEEFDLTLIPRTKKVHVGDDLVQQPVARTQQVVVGERDEQRIVGWRAETVVVAPARVETVRECVQTPERWVTVGPPGCAPLPGTAQAMTEAEYRAALTR